MCANISPKQYSVVSFFAGCGGLDLGFLGGFTYKGNLYSPLPFRIIKAYDNDPKCVDTYKRNIAENIECVDLSIHPAEVMPSSDVLIGGFPCQDFSSCGPRAGLNSSRGRLYMAFARYMIVHRPKIIVGENVPHLSRMDNGAVLKKMILDLEKPGYRFEVWRLSAEDYGVPQRRSRLFFIGVRNDIAFVPNQPVTTHENRPRTIRWAIGDLENVNDESIPNQSQYFRASRAKRGNGQGDETSRADEPAYTVRANAKSRVQFHYLLPRRLTVRECARIQTFPDNFVFPHSPTVNMLQIGNAVPPILAWHVASSIASFLDKHSEVLEPDLLGGGVLDVRGTC